MLLLAKTVTEPEGAIALTGPIITGYVAVGSNIDPEANIPRALKSLSRLVKITGLSTFYRTPAIDRPDQPNYLNGVVRIESDRIARAIKFDVLRKIEKELGRKRKPDKFAPRRIDLDLVLWGDEIIDTPELQIPDPHIRQRLFVAMPLYELDPNLVLPGAHETIESVIEQMKWASPQPAANFTARLKTIFKAGE